MISLSTGASITPAPLLSSSSSPPRPASSTAPADLNIALTSRPHTPLPLAPATRAQGDRGAGLRCADAQRPASRSSNPIWIEARATAHGCSPRAPPLARIELIPAPRFERWSSSLSTPSTRRIRHRPRPPTQQTLPCPPPNHAVIAALPASGVRPASPAQTAYPRSRRTGDRRPVSPDLSQLFLPAPAPFLRAAPRELKILMPSSPRAMYERARVAPRSSTPPSIGPDGMRARNPRPAPALRSIRLARPVPATPYSLASWHLPASPADPAPALPARAHLCPGSGGCTAVHPRAQGCQARPEPTFRRPRALRPRGPRREAPFPPPRALRRRLESTDARLARHTLLVSPREMHGGGPPRSGRCTPGVFLGS